LATRWRRQTGTDIACGQKSDDAVKPNTGMSGGELRALGGLAPTDLEGPGYFTLVCGRSVATVKVPYVSLADRTGFLAWYRGLMSGVDQGRGWAPAAVVGNQFPSLSRVVPADTDARNAGTITDDMIRAWLLAGTKTRNQVAAELGGRRIRANARIKLAMGEQLTEAEEREMSSVLAA
jgi:hypothetical protein